MKWPQIKVLFITILSILVFQAAAINKNEPELLYAVAEGIYRMAMDASYKKLIAPAINATSVDYHHKKRLVFWSDIATHKIYSKDLFDDFSEIKTVIAGPDNWEPKAIAVDWIYDKIYVMDKGGLKIDVFELDGSRKIEGIYRDLEDYFWNDAWDIAVDPYAGVVFFGNGFSVWRAPLDFSIVTSVTDKGHSSPITIDSEYQHLYTWSRDNILFGCNYDGLLRKYVRYQSNAHRRPNELMQAKTMTKFSPYFYYIETQKHPVYARGLNRLLMNNKTTIDNTMTNVVCLRALHPSKQGELRLIPLDSCGNDRCEYMCLTSNTKYTKHSHSCFNENGQRIKVKSAPEIVPTTTPKE